MSKDARRGFVAILWLAGVVWSPPLTAAEVGLRAGAAHEDITPDVEVLNWVTGKPYREVRDPLHVQALVLDDGRRRAVVLRWDLVDVSESARDAVRRAIGDRLGIPPEAILVHASHTHSAPWAPVYGDGQRGRERDTWWAIRYMPPQDEFPPYRRWKDRLIQASTRAVERAVQSLERVEMRIGRVAVPEYLYNRRPRAPAWGLADPAPRAIGHAHPEWNPDVLPGGATFGPMDRTYTLVSLMSPAGRRVATLHHLACHAVSIYPSTPAISADWPGAASAAISEALGGEAMFLQGTAGDITPWRRGGEAVAEMAAGLARKAQMADRHAVRLTSGRLIAARTLVDLPLTPAAQARTGLSQLTTEIQVITCGPLAFVALPGEPLTDLGTAIRERSRFPQTLVLGYANGNGVHYVGLPGEKTRGGYEAGVAGAGADECGALIIDAAVRLLEEAFARTERPAP